MNLSLWQIVALPALAALGHFGFSRWTQIKGTSRFTAGLSLIWHLTCSVTTFLAIRSIVTQVLSQGEALNVFWLFEVFPNLSIGLGADQLGLLFAQLSSFLWILAGVYAWRYLPLGGYDRPQAFAGFFALCIASVLGLCFAPNLASFFIFFELITLTTYPLVTHTRTDKALSAGRTYIAYTFLAAQCLLLGIIFIHSTGSDGIFRPGGMLGNDVSDLHLGIAATLIFLGVAVKAGVFPFHHWLPTAMVAPAPVSGLLHAVAVVKAGVFGVLRLFWHTLDAQRLADIGFSKAVLGLAAVTILYGSIKAVGEDHIKRRLAYSTISQLSYIVLGASLLHPKALLGAAFHIVAHGFMKITLFFGAGAIQVQTGKTNVSQLDGLSKVLPWTMRSFALAAIGMAGIPLWAGFTSKWNLGWGAMGSGTGLWIPALLIVSGLLNLAYFMPILTRSFFGVYDESSNIRSADAFLILPFALTALLSLLLGLEPDLFFDFYRLAEGIHP